MMKQFSHMVLQTALGLGLLSAFFACQNEETCTADDSLHIRVDVADRQVVTKAYSAYQVNGASLGLFTVPDDLPGQSQFVYNATDDEWVPQGDYRYSPQLEMGFIAYIPYSSNATVSCGSRWNSQLNVLTLPNLPVFNEKDIYVLNGINDAKKDHKAQVGNFVAKFQTLDPDHIEETTNSLDFKMIPASCKISLKFKMDADYALLRTIVVKQVKLQSNASTASLTASYTSASTAASPVAPTIALTSPTAKTTEKTLLYDTDDDDVCDPMTLTTTAQLYGEPVSFLGSNGSSVKLSLWVKYDVYDEAGQLTREDQVSVNGNLKLPSPTVPGTHYIFTVTVNPSYLYVLSDNDIENPYIILN